MCIVYLLNYVRKACLVKKLKTNLQNFVGLHYQLLAKWRVQLLQSFLSLAHSKNLCKRFSFKVRRPPGVAHNKAEPLAQQANPLSKPENLLFRPANLLSKQADPFSKPADPHTKQVDPLSIQESEATCFGSGSTDRECRAARRASKRTHKGSKVANQIR